jgi:hypothetical protein
VAHSARARIIGKQMLTNANKHCNNLRTTIADKLPTKVMGAGVFGNYAAGR